MGIISVLLAGSAVAACGSSAASTETTTPGASGGIPGVSGTTLASLTSTVKSQIISGRPKGLGFGSIGVAKVTCTPPAEWFVSARWTCVAYSRTGAQLGTYTGTVEPDGSDNGVNTPQWSGQFHRGS
jgi:hypothetical protein